MAIHWYMHKIYSHCKLSMYISIGIYRTILMKNQAEFDTKGESFFKGDVGRARLHSGEQRRDTIKKKKKERGIDRWCSGIDEPEFGVSANIIILIAIFRAFGFV